MADRTQLSTKRRLPRDLVFKMANNGATLIFIPLQNNMEQSNVRYKRHTRRILLECTLRTRLHRRQCRARKQAMNAFRIPTILSCVGETIECKIHLASSLFLTFVSNQRLITDNNMASSASKRSRRAAKKRRTKEQRQRKQATNESKDNEVEHVPRKQKSTKKKQKNARTDTASSGTVSSSERDSLSEESDTSSDVETTH